MDFYETVAGKQFYQGTMPQIARELKVLSSKKTMTIATTVMAEQICDEINEKAKENARYVDSIDIGDGWFTLVFEKECKE